MPLKRTWTKKIRPIEKSGNIAFVPLTRGFMATIDAADIPLVEGFNWTAKPDRSGCVYATNGRGMMHQIITGHARPDHRDGDGLNNRRANLRLATSQQNNRNRRIGIANKSGFKGVSLRADRNTWLAAIRLDGRLRKLGTFSSKEEAARAYDAVASKEFGEFAVLNFPDKFAEAAE